MPFRYRVRIDAIDATHFGLGKGALVEVSSAKSEAGDVLGPIGMSLRLPVPDQAVVATLQVGDVWTFDLAPDGTAAIPIMQVLSDRIARSEARAVALHHEVNQIGDQLADARDELAALKSAPTGTMPVVTGTAAADPAAAPAKPGAFKRAWLALTGRAVSDDVPAEDSQGADAVTP